MPDLFVSKLTTCMGRNVIILDDDTSIHQVWQGRFNTLQVTHSDFHVHHFSRPEQIRNWVAENTERSQDSVYLIDYELLGFKETGLSLIEELGIGSRSILVTSRFDENRIVEGCRRLGVRIIPKGMAGFVPIEVAVPSSEIY